MSNHVKIDLLQFYQNCISNPQLPVSYVSAVYDQIIELLQALESSEINELSELFSFHRFPRNTVLQKSQTPIKRLWLIESGMAHTYIEQNNAQSTCCFHITGELVGHYAFSKLNQQSELSIKTLSKMKCWSLEIDKLNQLCKRSPRIISIIDYLQIGKIAWLYKNEYYLRQLSPCERYQILISQFPYYFQKVPQKYIASYLKIAESSLSRIRSKLLKS